MKSPVHMVFDTETTGLFNFKLPADDPSQPRLASAAFLICDEAGEEIDAHKFYVRLEGWGMPAEAGAINGLTTEFLCEKGIPVCEVLDFYQEHIEAGRIVSAYNAQFDLKMMRSEFRRAGRDDLFERTPNLCLMRNLDPYGADGLCINRGFVKLSVACEFFGIVNEDAHDALSDARAARGILARLIRDGRLPEAKVHFAKNPPVRDEPASVAAETEAEAGA